MESSPLGTVLVFILALTLVNCQSNYFLGDAKYYGCFVNDPDKIEFLTVAPHANPSTITPLTCAQACAVMGYPVSRIQFSTFCFCRQTLGLQSAQVADSNCFSSGVCPGDSNYYCGTGNYTLVYSSSMNSTLTVTPTVAQPSLALFSYNTYTYQTSAVQNNVVFRIANRGLASNSNSTTGSSNLKFVKTGYNSIEASASSAVITKFTQADLVLPAQKVYDNISNFSISCDPYGSTLSALNCDLFMDKGTETTVQAQYTNQSGTFTSSFQAYDAELYAYGVPVPQDIPSTFSNLAQLPTTEINVQYIVLNSAFTFDGYLRAIELLTNNSGTVTITLYQVAGCSTTYSKIQNYAQCSSTYKLSQQFSCSSSGSFSYASKRCTGDDSNIEKTFKSGVTFTSYYSVPFSVSAGYNLITSFGNKYVKSGTMVGISSSDTKIVLNTVDDMTYSDIIYSSSISYKMNSTSGGNAGLYVRALVTRPVHASVMSVYPQIGVNTVSFSTTSPVSLSSPGTFAIYEPIVDAILHAPTFCQTFTICQFPVTMYSGSNITYTWSLYGPNLNLTNQTTVPVFQYVFTAVNTFFIRVTLQNQISNFTSQVYQFEAIDLVTGLKFFAASPYDSSLSASATNQNASFLFTLATGTNYACNVSFGDGSKLYFTDQPISYNNTVFRHVYTQANTYQVIISCKNPYSVSNSTISHLVQDAITGAVVPTVSATLGSNYMIDFAISGGTLPSFVLLFNGVSLTFTYNSATKSGFSSTLTATSVNINSVNLTVYNQVSQMQVIQDLQIGVSVIGVVFTVENTPLIDPDIFDYSQSMTYKVDMTYGSNVRIQFFSGEETDLTLPSLDVTLPGMWTAPYIFTYTFSEPGSYYSYVNVSNVYGYSVKGQTVNMITNVSDIIPYLKSDPVPYTVLGAQAYYLFSYYGTSMSGALADIVIWPGDQANATFGPYRLGLNFKTNQTTNQFTYDYLKIGQYIAVFNISNILGWQWYTLNVSVDYGLYGLYVNFPTSIATNSPFQISTYLIQGSGVMYNWTFDGQVHSAPRTASSYLVADNTTFTTRSTPGQAVLRVMAIKYNFYLELEYTVYIQEPVTSVTLTTNPSSTSSIYNYGSISRTITFTFTVANQPTDPYYLIDYGDLSDVQLAQVYTIGSTVSFTYTYSTGGSFKFNLTVYNEISSVSVFKTITIYNKFSLFDCQPYWRQNDIDDTQENAYIQDSNSYYRVYTAYDLRFHCSWYNSFATQLTLTVGSDTITFNNMTGTGPSMYQGLPIAYSMILPYSSSSLGQLVSNETTASISITNGIYSSLLKFNISLLSPIAITSIDPITTRIAPSSLVKFYVNYISLGEPSCAQIRFKSTTSNFSVNRYTIGSSASACASLYPNVPFREVYSRNGSKWWFNTTSLNQSGYIQLTVTVRNNFLSQAISSYVTVSNLDCSPPQLTLSAYYPYFYSPLQIKRSAQFSIVATPTISCALSVYNIKGWSLYEVSSTNGSVLRQVSLNNNEFASNNELVIQSNKLSYGVYKFVYSMRMYSDNVDLSAFQSEIYSFVEIVPTGIVVLGLRGGVNQLTLGVNQSFTFNPLTYSFDQDNLVSMSSLSFKFYCNVIDAGIPVGYPQSTVNNYIDLASFQSNSFNMTYNTTCFNSSDAYTFDSTGNQLTIDQYALQSYTDRMYTFKIAVTYLDTVYYQEINVIMMNTNALPIVSIACVPFYLCSYKSSFIKINPNTQISLDGNCDSGCENALSLTYSYQIYKKFNLTVIGTRWVPYLMPHTVFNSTQEMNGLDMVTSNDVMGSDTLDCTILPSFFLIDPYAVYYLVELTVKSITKAGINSGTSSIIFYKNQIPVGGSCSISPSNGISMVTNFTVTCPGWIDKDGYLVRYEFYAQIPNTQQVITLGYETTSTGVFQLPQGPDYYNNSLKVFVHIVDNDDGIAVYNLPSMVTVTPNANKFASIVNTILSESASSQTFIDLFSGSSQEVLTLVQTISATANSQMYSALNSLNSNTASSVSYLPYQSLGSSTNYYTASSGSISTSCDAYVGVSSPNISQATANEIRQNMSLVNDALISALVNVSVSDAASLKLFSGVTNSLSQVSSVVSLTSASTLVDLCTRMSNALNEVQDTMSLEDLNIIANNLLGTAYNTIAALTSRPNGFCTSLNQDLELASQPVTDSDPENVYNNYYQINADSSISSLSTTEKILTLKQKYEITEAVQRAQTILSSITTMVGPRLALEQSFLIQSSYMTSIIGKTRAEKLNSTINLGLGQWNFPSFCNSLYTSLNSWQPITTANPYYTPADYSCGKKIIVYEGHAITYSYAGFNGQNETMIQNSTVQGFNFYNGTTMSSIPIQNAVTPIIVKVTKNPTAGIPGFTEVNKTYLDDFVSSNNTSGFLQMNISISMYNSSLFIQVKPNSSDTGYFLWTKAGSLPYLKDTGDNYDYRFGFCPYELMTQFNDTFYQLVLNSSSLQGFKGYYGYGIREMSLAEYEAYCINDTQAARIPKTNKWLNFTNTFSLRIFTASCYYFDESTGKYTSYGVYLDTALSNISVAVCSAYHLTDYAGGFVVLPADINFSNVFANADFTQNPTLYGTVIGTMSFFIILLIFACFMDLRDKDKLGINLLPDNQPTQFYCYEIIVFTGGRSEAATNSKVRFILGGHDDDTGIRRMSDTRRNVFQRGGIDSFIMTVDKPLGQLNYLRIWHDNSGQGDYASWYLRFVIVQDLQTKESFYFLCDRWLAVEKDDGRIERLLSVATDQDKKNVVHAARKQAKNRIADKHLWFSVFIKRPENTFTRMDRVTCCFVLLFLSMFVNIMYYNQASTNSTTLLAVGPFALTAQQIGIGIISNLIIFPIMLILIQLFKKSRRRTNPLTRMEKFLNKQKAKQAKLFGTLNQEMPKVKNPSPELTLVTVPDQQQNKQKQIFSDRMREKLEKGANFKLPWWFKIVAYVMSSIIISVSLFFIWAYGITLGEEKVKAWLISFIISVLTSVLFHDPIKIMLLTIVFVLIFRKDGSDHDLDFDKQKDEDLHIKRKRQLNEDMRFEQFRDYTIGLEDGRLTDKELAEARHHRNREIVFWKLAKRLFAYLVFLMLLYTLCVQQTDPDMYRYKSQLENLFFNNADDSITLGQLFTPENFWNWIINSFSDRYRIATWYNGDAVTGLAGFMTDFNSKVIGYAKIRQSRVEPNSCVIAKTFANEISYCDSNYMIYNEETADFGYSWSTDYNDSYSADYSMKRIYSAFQYQSPSILGGSSFSGLYTTYTSGGYVYEARGTLSQIKSNLSTLQSLGWIDRQTRAVFVEFNVYNPNIDKFAVCMFVFEFMSSGNVIISHTIKVLNLFTNMTDQAISIVAGVLYLAAIVILMAIEIRKIYVKKKKYFRSVSWLVDWSLFACSWATFGVYLQRLYDSNGITKFISDTKGYAFINLQRASQWFDVQMYLFAFCVLFASLKLIELVKWHSSVILVIKCWNLCVNVLISVTVIYLLIYMAFVQMYYIIFNAEVEAFSTIPKAMSSLFQYLLGKNDVSAIVAAQPYTGPFLFIGYSIVGVFILLNLFFATVDETFRHVRIHREFYLADNDVGRYVKFKVKKLASDLKATIKFKKEKEEPVFKEHAGGRNGFETLPSKLNQLLGKINFSMNETRVVQECAEYQNDMNVVKDKLMPIAEKKSVSRVSSAPCLSVNDLKIENVKETQPPSPKSASRNTSTSNVDKNDDAIIEEVEENDEKALAKPDNTSPSSDNKETSSTSEEKKEEKPVKKPSAKLLKLNKKTPGTSSFKDIF